MPTLSLALSINSAPCDGDIDLQGVYNQLERQDRPQVSRKKDTSFSTPIWCWFVMHRHLQIVDMHSLWCCIVWLVCNSLTASQSVWQTACLCMSSMLGDNSLWIAQVSVCLTSVTLTIFSRIFVQRKALGDRASVSPQSKGQACLLPL